MKFAFVSVALSATFLSGCGMSPTRSAPPPPISKPSAAPPVAPPQVRSINVAITQQPSPQRPVMEVAVQMGGVPLRQSPLAVRTPQGRAVELVTDETGTATIQLDRLLAGLPLDAGEVGLRIVANEAPDQPVDIRIPVKQIAGLMVELPAGRYLRLASPDIRAAKRGVMDFSTRWQARLVGIERGFLHVCKGILDGWIARPAERIGTYYSVNAAETCD